MKIPTSTFQRKIIPMKKDALILKQKGLFDEKFQHFNKETVKEFNLKQTDVDYIKPPTR